MEFVQNLSPQLRRRFRTGRISLDFTHTGGEGDYARWELLHRPADAARFLGLILGTKPPHIRPSDMAHLVELRAAITDMARARAAGMPQPSVLVGVINGAATRPALVPELAGDGTAQLLTGSASRALSTLARDAIDLFSGPLADRIRVCEAEDCGLLFVDASRPGRRRWCSMEWCGDRHKKRTAGRPVPQGDTK